MRPLGLAGARAQASTSQVPTGFFAGVGALGWPLLIVYNQTALTPV